MRGLLAALTPSLRSVPPFQLLGMAFGVAFAKGSTWRLISASASLGTRMMGLAGTVLLIVRRRGASGRHWRMRRNQKVGDGTTVSLGPQPVQAPPI